MTSHTMPADQANPLAVLYVDDEETSLKHFKKIFDGKFMVLTALSAREGLQILRENKDGIGILLTDQRMPGEKGTQFLQKVRKHYPHMLRILITAYPDIEATTDAVNTGGIYKYVRKPWDIPELEMTLIQGLAFFAFKKRRHLLIRKKFSGLKERVRTDHLQSLRIFTAGLSRYLYDPVAELKSFIDRVPDKILEEHFCNITSKTHDNRVKLLATVQAQVERILLILLRLNEAIKKPKNASFHQIRIQEVVSQVTDHMKLRFKEKTIKIENNIPKSLPPIKAVPDMLYRLFGLLLEDELSSLPEGEEIRLFARSITGTTSECTQLQIKIEDNGPKLRKESRDHIFEPFYIRSQDPKELGLNLCVCFFIVHFHGGKIEARNNRRGGTTFIITIPTTPYRPKFTQENADFFHKIVWNEAIWESLLTEKLNYQLIECVINAYNRGQ